MTSFALMALAWLLALSLTMGMTLLDLESDGGSFSGVQGHGTCEWGSGKWERVVKVRVIQFGFLHLCFLHTVKISGV